MCAISWPAGKTFAFTVFDDTDLTTLQNGPPIYNLLHDLGFRTTKSVWLFESEATPVVGGATCQQADYLAWTQKLQRQGFEIALHNVSHSTSTRAQTQTGLALFKQHFGSYPAIHVNHTGCNEDIYWGDARLTGLRRIIYNLLTRFANAGKFQGHMPTSPLFWGDLCRAHIRYVRNFVFPHINTLKACPHMPYVDATKPYVNAWFASSEGADIHAYNNMLSEPNQDQLEAEGGACIMYTHFGSGFFVDGAPNARFTELMTRLSRKNGWFVPVTTLLDHICLMRSRCSDSAHSAHNAHSAGDVGVHRLTNAERSQLEWRWLISKIRTGGTS
jgi:hypothetical protein